MRKIVASLALVLMPAAALATPPAIPPSSTAKLVKNQDRLRLWASAFRGQTDLSVMSSPPTVTYTYSAVSTLNASNNAASLPAQGLYTNFECKGNQSYVANNGNPNNPALQPRGVLGVDNTNYMSGNVTRCRAVITAPRFEIVVSEQTGTQVDLVVDGQFVNIYNGANGNGVQSGNTRYIKVDFGADTTSYGIIGAATTAGGTGYAVGDVLTVSGGTCSRQPKVMVAVVSGGVIQANSLKTIDPGDCTVLPTYPATLTGGSGTGATTTPPFFFPRHSTMTARNVEILFRNCYFYGINYVQVGNAPMVVPWKSNPIAPSIYWLGDSQDGATYSSYAGAEIGYSVALRLGLNVTIDALGGTGFNVNSGNAPAFEHANRVNAIIAAAPDLVVFPYSQNVGANNQSTSQTAALSFVNTLMAALPQTRFVMIGPAFGHQAWHSAAMSYVMSNAIDPRRIRMVDTIGQGWDSGLSSDWLVSDATHWGEEGNYKWRSKLLANAIAYAVQDMANSY